MKDIPDGDWLQQWTALARSFALRYNPALQPRALIVFGCISKSASDSDVKQLLRILLKALESFSDITLIEAIVMCLTRLQPLLRRDSPIHRALFWVALSVLQLDEVSLYSAGLALLEMNLHTLDTLGAFYRVVSDYFLKNDCTIEKLFKTNLLNYFLCFFSLWRR
jgi:neurofibromin 1